MKQCIVLFLLCLTGLGPTACGSHAKSPIATVDTTRLLQYWPKYQNANNQFSVDVATIDRSRAAEKQKAIERYQLQVKYAQVQKDLTDDVRHAAEQVAKDNNYQLVMTHDYVAYGGTDITADVEKILKITETSPSASP